MARPLWHLAVALGIGILQYRTTGRRLPAIAPLATGFLLDGDHLLDYALYQLAPPGGSERARRKMVLALHGWELMLLTAALEPLLLRGKAATAHGLALGYLAHLVVDQVANEPEHPLAYSLFYRASRGFEGPFFTPNPERAWRQEPLIGLLKRF